MAADESMVHNVGCTLNVWKTEVQLGPNRVSVTHLDDSRVNQAVTTINAEIVIARASQECTALLNADELPGKIAVLDATICPWTTITGFVVKQSSARAVILVILFPSTGGVSVGEDADNSARERTLCDALSKGNGPPVFIAGSALDAATLMAAAGTQARLTIGLPPPLQPAGPHPCFFATVGVARAGDGNCTEGEVAQLDELGMQSSSLDAPQTIVALLGGTTRNSDNPVMTSLTGTISTDGGYPDRANCAWQIQPLGATSVTLTFSSFSTESAYDIVRVFAGLDLASPLLAELSGPELPAAVISPTGAMLVVLWSDIGKSGQGFLATYKADNASPHDVAGSPQVGWCRPATAAVSSQCRMCILATISSICGVDCARDHLHLQTDSEQGRFTALPSRCLPALAARLEREQGKRLDRAVEQSLVLSLVVGRVSRAAPTAYADLFMPSEQRFGGRAVFVGTYTGDRGYYCEPRGAQSGVWIITTSADEATWVRCEGQITIDLSTGMAIDAQRHQARSAATVPLFITPLGECAAVLKSPAPLVAGSIAFGRGTRPEVVACWLAFLFGPHTHSTAIGTSPVPDAILLLADLGGNIRLLTDVIVSAGRRLSIIGAGGASVLVVGARQLRVSRGGQLNLENLAVADSAGASALVVEGKLFAQGVLFRDCRARMNILNVVRTIYGDSDSAFELALDSQGGALHALLGGEVELSGTNFTHNIAADAVRCKGGAIYAVGANIGLVGSLFLGNQALGRFDGALGALVGDCTSNGGAIAGDIGATISVASSSFVSNSASLGGAVSVKESKLSVSRSTFERNRAVSCIYAATSPAGTSNMYSDRGGGGVYVHSSTLLMNGSRMEENAAVDRDGCGGGIFLRSSQTVLQGMNFVANSAALGGAIFDIQVYTRGPCVTPTSSFLSDSSVRSNVAVYKGGGVFYRSCSHWQVARCKINGNAAGGGSFGNDAWGGAMYLDDRASVVISGSEFLSNSASGFLARGGCVHLQAGSTLITSHTEFVLNTVWSSAGSARGGCFSVLGDSDQPAHVELKSVLLSGSEARTGHRDDDGLIGVCRQTEGGAIFADGGVNLTVVACRAEENRAIAASSPARGGFITALRGVILIITDSTISGNEAVGSSAYGGAVCASSERLRIEHSKLCNNSASAIMPSGANVGRLPVGEALGGAIYLEPPVVAIIGHCILEKNLAHVTRARRASAGALFVAVGAEVGLTGSLFRNNCIGGSSNWNKQTASTSDVVALAATSAACIHVQGRAKMDLCEISDLLGLPAENTPDRPWVVAEAFAAVVLSSSVFTMRVSYTFDLCPFANDGVCDEPLGGTGYCDYAQDNYDCGVPSPDGPGLFLNVVSPAEVLIRNCTVTNLTLKAEAVIGIVNVSFTPALNPSIDTVLPSQGPSPKCDRKVAGEHVCDPRAQCTRLEKGGVHCECKRDDGLLGYTAKGDGTGLVCEERPAANVTFQVEKLLLRLPKPGPPNKAEPAKVVVHARGEEPLVGQFSLRMELMRRVSGDAVVNGRHWPSLRESSIEWFGLRLAWQGEAPSNNANLTLDGRTQTFSSTREYVLQMDMQCTSQSECAADGDKLRAVIGFNALTSSEPQQQTELRQLTVEVTVEAVPSCVKTIANATIELGQDRLWHDQSEFGIHVAAFDADGMPISWTRTQIVVRWARTSDDQQSQNRPISYDWSGGHLYTIPIPGERRSRAGQYKLTVELAAGIPQPGDAAPARCVLLGVPRDLQVECSPGFGASADGTCRVTGSDTILLTALAASIGCCGVAFLIAGYIFYRCRQRHQVEAAVLSEARKRWYAHLLRQAGRSTVASANCACALPMADRRPDEPDEYGYLSLHCAAACLAPDDMLQDLIAAYPAGVEALDNRRNLPLHLVLHELGASETPSLALLANGVRVVRQLLSRAPHTAIVEDGSGKLPVQLALEILCLEVELHALHEELVSILGLPVNCNRQADGWYRRTLPPPSLPDCRRLPRMRPSHTWEGI